jgi:hypothetical protein
MEMPCRITPMLGDRPVAAIGVPFLRQCEIPHVLVRRRQVAAVLVGVGDAEDLLQRVDAIRLPGKLFERAEVPGERHMLRARSRCTTERDRLK